MSVIIDFAIFPMDKGESLSPYVARAVKIIRASGLPHTLTPMGSCIEGEWDEVMAVVARCFTDLRQDCDRINVSFKADYRKGAPGRMDRKLASVSQKL
jgi:uncharacterized protein (TIGR00106 family)